jgi:hypothetical protein
MKHMDGRGLLLFSGHWLIDQILPGTDLLVYFYDDNSFPSEICTYFFRYRTVMIFKYFCNEYNKVTLPLASIRWWVSQ